MKIVAISGGFDPIHTGHINLLEEAKKLGDLLVVIVNNDNWIKKKKGYVFMSEDERINVMRKIRGVDLVMLSGHEQNPNDMSVSKELSMLRPNIFANGGDRNNKNILESSVCKKLSIKTVFGVGGEKVQSSSELVRNANGNMHKAKA